MSNLNTQELEKLIKASNERRDSYMELGNNPKISVSEAVSYGVRAEYFAGKCDALTQIRNLIF